MHETLQQHTLHPHARFVTNVYFAPNVINPFYKVKLDHPIFNWIILSCFVQSNDANEQNQYTHRRMSDPSESFGSFVRGGIRRLSMKKSRSETEDVNTGIENCQEVEATTLQSGKTGRIS